MDHSVSQFHIFDWFKIGNLILLQLPFLWNLKVSFSVCFERQNHLPFLSS